MNSRHKHQDFHTTYRSASLARNAPEAEGLFLLTGRTVAWNLALAVKTTSLLALFFGESLGLDDEATAAEWCDIILAA